MISIYAISLLKVALIGLWLGDRVSSVVFAALLNPLTAIALYYFVRKHVENKLYPAILLVIDLTLPAVGFIGVVLFHLFGFVFRYINYHEEEEEYLMPFESTSYRDFELEKKSELRNGQGIPRDILSAFNVQPLQEVLLGDCETQYKVSAIENLGRIADRKAVEILKRGLKEKEYEVRYFSNGALEDIENQKLERISELSERILEDPENSETYNERGSAYLEIYRLGLLDPSVENVFLEKALLDFMTSLSLKPKQSYLYTRIVEVNLLLKKYGELINLAEYALMVGIDDSDKGKIYFYEAEAHFIKGDFEKARECCEKASQYNVQWDLIQSCLGWWLNAA